MHSLTFAAAVPRLQCHHLRSPHGKPSSSAVDPRNLWKIAPASLTRKECSPTLLLQLLNAVPSPPPSQHAMCLGALHNQLQPGMRALDVGHGTGYLAACMALMVGPSGQVIHSSNSSSPSQSLALPLFLCTLAPLTTRHSHHRPSGSNTCPSSSPPRRKTWKTTARRHSWIAATSFWSKETAASASLSMPHTTRFT